MWLSVTVKRVSSSVDPLRVRYQACVSDGEERTTIDVFVSAAAARPDRAESAIKLRLVREINEMPSGRRWPDYLKELAPVELSSREA